MLKERDVTIDILKGVLIFLVTWGHMIQFSHGVDFRLEQMFYNDIIFRVIYSFHMPLFMFISGYLFYESNKKSVWNILCSKSMSIFVPMTVVNSIVFSCNFYGLLKSGHILSFLHLWANCLINGYVMWFLLAYCFCVALVVFWSRLFQRKVWLYTTFMLISVSSAFVPDCYLQPSIKFVLPFFFLGYFCKDYNLNLYLLANSKPAFLLVGCASVAAILCYPIDLFVYRSSYYLFSGNALDVVLSILIRFSIAVLVGTFFIALIYRVQSRLLSFQKVGKISIFIYEMNSLSNMALVYLTSYFSINVRHNYLIPFIGTIGLVYVCMYVCRRFSHNTLFNTLFIGRRSV